MLTVSYRKPARLVAAGLMALLAACADSSGPVAGPAELDAANPGLLSNDLLDLDLQFRGLPALNLLSRSRSDTVVQTFTIDPRRGGLVTFGPGHVVAISPRAICDPATSGYGPGTWLNSCKEATSPIAFTVQTYTTRDGRPGATFLPDVRFVPGKVVKLYFRDFNLIRFGGVSIPWCDAAGTCVNEGNGDPWQLTHVLRLNVGFWVYRNLRHFSNYMVAY